MKEIISKIYVTKGRHYLYLPSGLVRDSAFPLNLSKKLRVRIAGEYLIVEQ